MWSKRINGEDPAETFPAIPDLVVVFGPTDRLADRGLTDRLMSSCGDAIVIGCSSGTMVDGDGLDDDAVVLLGMGFERTKLALAVQPLPSAGSVFISVNDQDKPEAVGIARELAALGFKIIATRGTAAALAAAGLKVERVYKVNEGRPNVVDLIKSGSLGLLINTPLGRTSRFDEKAIRRAAVQHGVSCITTLSAAGAVVSGIRAQRGNGIQVTSLQELHERKASGVRGQLSVATGIQSKPIVT